MIKLENFHILLLLIHRDLLAKEMHNLKLREHPEHGVFVDGLLTEVCNSVSDLKHYMSIGNKQRSIG